jgi:hypothetical protein
MAETLLPQVTRATLDQLRPALDRYEKDGLTAGQADELHTLCGYLADFAETGRLTADLLEDALAATVRVQGLLYLMPQDADPELAQIRASRLSVIRLRLARSLRRAKAGSP